MRSATRASRALVAGFLVASTLLAGGAAAALAQADTGVGVEVPFVDDEGVARGTIEVRDINDPFLDFDPSAPPPAGTRYVGMTAAFTAADDQQFETYPFGVTLHDTNGGLWSPGFVPRPADALIPDAESQRMAPGNRLSGFIGYTLPEDVVIDQVLYQPDYYRAIVLADLVSGPGPAAGDVVPYATKDGASVALSAEVMDPFTGNDPGGPPQAGTRYVVVKGSFENTGDVRFLAEPYQVLVHTTNGHLVYATYVPRPFDAPIPDLESQTLSPGDHISGYIGYLLAEDAVIASIDFQPDASTRVVVADLLGGEPVGPGATQVPADSPAPSEPAASAGSAQ